MDIDLLDRIEDISCQIEFLREASRLMLEAGITGKAASGLVIIFDRVSDDMELLKKVL